MRMFVILAASTLLLLGCNTKSHKTSPRPLAKKAVFALYVVSATSGANTKTDTDPETGAAIYLTTPAVITSTDVASVHLSKDSPVDSSLSLNVRLTPTGATKLSAATATPNGMRLAVVVNDKVVAAPKLHSKLSNSISFSSGTSEAMLDLLTRD